MTRLNAMTVTSLAAQVVSSNGSRKIRRALIVEPHGTQQNLSIALSSKLSTNLNSTVICAHNRIPMKAKKSTGLFVACKSSAGSKIVAKNLKLWMILWSTGKKSAHK